MQQVATMPSVQAALLAKARLVFGIAQTEAYKQGRVNLGDQMRITSGVRPGAKAAGFRRSYARVESTLTEEQQKQDNARGKKSRAQIMRRAARG
jgi:hypothetical protein